MNMTELTVSMGIFNKYASSNGSSVVDAVTQLQPEYEAAVYHPYESAIRGATYGAISTLGASLGYMMSPKSRTGMLLGLLGGIGLPALTNVTVEYTRKDDKAKQQIKDDLDDIRSDIAMAESVYNADPRVLEQLHQKRLEIEKYLNSN